MAYVMMVDDDADFASAAATVLRHAGHEVAMAHDVRSALARMAERRPDLAILDVMFPENDSAGFDLARTLRQQDEKLARLPVLMLTAVNTRYPLGFGPEDIDDTWLPVADFLEKPIDLDVLVEKVSALLARAAAQAGPPKS
jgi:DNA-binding response OmpR family regulator